MSIRCQAGFKATEFKLLKHIQIGNLKKKKKAEYSFNFFVQIYHEGEENFILNKRIRSIPYENKWFRKTRLECHLGASIAITPRLRSELPVIYIVRLKKNILSIFFMNYGKIFRKE